MRIIKALAIFWLAIVPVLFLALVFGPAFTNTPIEHQESHHCDAACMDELLSD